MKRWAWPILGALLVACNHQTKSEIDRDIAIARIQALKALHPPPRPKPPVVFRSKLLNITRSPKGISARRFDSSRDLSKYLEVYDPLEPEAALITVQDELREHLVLGAYGQYPSGKLVEFATSGVLGRPATQVSIPSGYGPDLQKGRLILVGRREQEVVLPLDKLPPPTETDVERLPQITRLGRLGKQVSVTLRRGMGGPGLAPDPAVDKKGHDQMHEELRFTSAFFTTKVDPGLAPGCHIDLVMRLRRTRWSDQPGPWLWLRARDVLDPKFEPTDEYSLNVDPRDKLAEFECVVVETKVVTETIRIPAVGTLGGTPLSSNLNHNPTGRTPSGWTVRFANHGVVEESDRSDQPLNLPVSLLSPSGKSTTCPEDVVSGDFREAHYISSISLSGHSSTQSMYEPIDPGEPFYGFMGYWHPGSLGDATVTVVHLYRTRRPLQLLRLPLLPGGRSRGKEKFINSGDEL